MLAAPLARSRFGCAPGCQIELSHCPWYILQQPGVVLRAVVEDLYWAGDFVMVCSCATLSSLWMHMRIESECMEASQVECYKCTSLASKPEHDPYTQCTGIFRCDAVIQDKVRHGISHAAR